MKTNPAANSAPIVVALPNTTEQKMRAIVELSAAVANLSRALVSTNTFVRVENCTVVGAKGAGISIETAA